MNNVAVVYWSGTGNTTAMAEAVAKGCSGKLFPSDQFDAAKVDAFDAIAFGCPSMGNEELEDSEFAPMFENCLPELSGRKIALFGSYGWGDGEWMRIWEEECVSRGALLAHSSVICREAPDGEAKSQCIEMGRALVS